MTVLPVRPPSFYLTAPTLPGAPANVIYAAPLQLQPSSLRPNCAADQRIFLWRGVNTPPPATLDVPVLQRLAAIASENSLRDAGSYGSGLRKFHIFCDIFHVPEADRLAARYNLLHSFALWAAADPQPEDVSLVAPTSYEPVARVTVKKYLAAIRAWHIAQGWPPPLSPEDAQRIQFSLRGLANIQAGRRTKPPRPPVTLHQLATLKSDLDLSSPFDACIWAMACCAFWGVMRFGEVSVTSRGDFSHTTHLARGHSHFDRDLNGRRYARLDLPRAKTAKPGEVQSVFLVEEGTLCPLDALENLGRVVPASADDPLFSWRDNTGAVRPMTKKAALARINGIFDAHGWKTTFGHSFRIGGASFYLSQGKSPEVVRLAGRWKSLAYEAYIRAFEQVVSHHLADLPQRYYS